MAVQLIQEEEPRLLTTEAEQERLGRMQGSDKTLVRATFDWNHLHNDEYQANRIIVIVTDNFRLAKAATPEEGLM